MMPQARTYPLRDRFHEPLVRRVHAALELEGVKLEDLL